MTRVGSQRHRKKNEIKDSTHENNSDQYREVHVRTVAIMPSLEVLFIAVLMIRQFFLSYV